MHTAAKVQQLLEDWQTALSELEKVQAAKRNALASLDSATLESLSNTEGLVAQAMRSLVERRENLAKEIGLSESPSTLTQIVFQLGELATPAIRESLDRVRQLASRVRVDVAVNWMSLWRTNHHVGELLGIVKRAGHSNAPRSATHGIVFDSTA